METCIDLDLGLLSLLSFPYFDLSSFKVELLKEGVLDREGGTKEGALMLNELERGLTGSCIVSIVNVRNQLWN